MSREIEIKKEQSVGFISSLKDGTPEVYPAIVNRAANLSFKPDLYYVDTGGRSPLLASDLQLTLPGMESIIYDAVMYEHKKRGTLIEKPKKLSLIERIKTFFDL